jgi:hypothetical protein
MEHALICPQCNAPLAPSRFAQTVICSYCGTTVKFDDTAISVERFHKAFRAWNAPESYPIPAWFSIGDSYWGTGESITGGDISDVYAGLRARWPTELVVIKILRDRRDVMPFDREWEALQILQQSNAPGADFFSTLIPQPVIHGDISKGVHAGQRANIFRWSSGFNHAFEEVMRVYPQGIPPRASIWVWRRILEVLSFIHNSGMVHGAVLPSHLLVQDNEHGVKLVGYSAADRAGVKLQTISSRYASFYPKSMRSLSAQLDITMSARCMIAILGGNPEAGTLPKAVPSRLTRLMQQIAEPAASTKTDAWSLREELGVIAQEVFGAPQFTPIVMPS